MEAVENFINSGAEPAERMIRDLVECELAYINTDHAQFLGGSRAIGMVMERRSRLQEDEALDDVIGRSNQSTATELAMARHHNKAAGMHWQLLAYNLCLSRLHGTGLPPWRPCVR